MVILDKGKTELNRWLTNLKQSFNNIEQPEIDMILYSDASLKGWGAALDNQSTGGNWSSEESKNHINVLEMKAALFALKSFASRLIGKHVKIMIDNTTAVYVINNMGTSHNDKCNAITVAIWEYCMAKQIYITAAHLHGSTNIVADRESRLCYREAEWMLNSNYLKTALLELEFQPEIDLFASRQNKQFTN